MKTSESAIERLDNIKVSRPTTLAELHQVSVRSQLNNYQSLGYFPRVLLFAGPKVRVKLLARIIGALLRWSKMPMLFIKRTSRKTKKNCATGRSRPIHANCSEDTDCNSLRGTWTRCRQAIVALTKYEPWRSGSVGTNWRPHLGLHFGWSTHVNNPGFFNALLKLLEEPRHIQPLFSPPQNYKIPETIVPRCQIVVFTRLPSDMTALGGR